MQDQALKDLLVQHVPESFWRRLLEGADTAFPAVENQLRLMACETPELSNTRGQLRHAFCEKDFRIAAKEAGGKPKAPHTAPRGGRFSLVRFGKFLIGRAKISCPGSAPHHSKFRKELAHLNAFLSAHQLDLFKEELDLPDDTIFSLIVTVAPKPSDDQTRPLYVGVGIPDAELQSWLFTESISSMIAAYESSGDVIIPDRAVPRLRRANKRKTEE